MANNLEEMVDTQIARRGVTDARVLAALRKVPRGDFVPAHVTCRAFDDCALPIGDGQTISQPYIVGIMSELLAVETGGRILEIGTGSGYQTAVLAELGAEIYTMEIVPTLAARAEARLTGLGYENIHFRCGDGYLGWPDEAPFDGILVAAAPVRVPPALIAQLACGGRLVLPLGRAGDQDLCVMVKRGRQIEERRVIPVRFVPMTGGATG